jgi:hypothetical protein
MSASLIKRWCATCGREIPAGSSQCDADGSTDFVSTPPPAVPPAEPGAPAEPAAQPGARRPRLIERLGEVEEARLRGLITPEEYEAARAQILRDV